MKKIRARGEDRGPFQGQVLGEEVTKEVCWDHVNRKGVTYKSPSGLMCGRGGDEFRYPNTTTLTAKTVTD
jgi:hypothetical protein